MGSVAFVSIGVLLGTLLPSARAAQAIGLLLFFPSFLLGVGGPPPAVMSDALRQIADLLPLALANQAIREPWLGIGDATRCAADDRGDRGGGHGARRPAHARCEATVSDPTPRTHDGATARVVAPAALALFAVLGR